MIVFLLVLLASMPALAQSAPPPTEIDLCRQQLITTHDSGDSRERKMALAMAEQHAAAEARAATMLEWLKAAQAGAKP